MSLSSAYNLREMILNTYTKKESTQEQIMVHIYKRYIYINEISKEALNKLHKDSI